jgi:hypothetical protein
MVLAADRPYRLAEDSHEKNRIDHAYGGAIGRDVGSASADCVFTGRWSDTAPAEVHSSNAKTAPNKIEASA